MGSLLGGHLNPTASRFDLPPDPQDFSRPSVRLGVAGRGRAPCAGFRGCSSERSNHAIPTPDG